MRSTGIGAASATISGKPRSLCAGARERQAEMRHHHPQPGTRDLELDIDHAPRLTRAVADIVAAHRAHGETGSAAYCRNGHDVRSDSSLPPPYSLADAPRNSACDSGAPPPPPLPAPDRHASSPPAGRSRAHPPQGSLPPHAVDRGGESDPTVRWNVVGCGAKNDYSKTQPFAINDRAFRSAPQNAARTIFQWL